MQGEDPVQLGRCLWTRVLTEPRHPHGLLEPATPDGEGLGHIPAPSGPSFLRPPSGPPPVLRRMGAPSTGSHRGDPGCLSSLSTVLAGVWSPLHAGCGWTDPARLDCLLCKPSWPIPVVPRTSESQPGHQHVHGVSVASLVTRDLVIQGLVCSAHSQRWGLQALS